MQSLCCNLQNAGFLMLFLPPDTHAPYPIPQVRNAFGTVRYASPEMANDVCGQKADIWSAGVVMYILLCGKVRRRGWRGMLWGKVRDHSMSAQAPSL